MTSPYAQMYLDACQRTNAYAYYNGRVSMITKLAVEFRHSATWITEQLTMAENQLREKLTLLK